VNGDTINNSFAILNIDLTAIEKPIIKVFLFEVYNGKPLNLSEYKYLIKGIIIHSEV